MLKAIVIDDEPIAVDVVTTLAANIPFIELTKGFTNAFEAMDHLRRESVDLIFLDIKMPDISGIDLLKALPDPPLVIITTAYSEHAVQSFELDVIDYLLKPFSLARFVKACNKAAQQYELRKKAGATAAEPRWSGAGSITSIFIKSGYEQVRVHIGDILYAESNGNYVQFVMADKKILSRLTMAEAEALLPASCFVRIHRSYLVAKSQVTRIDRNTVWVGVTALPVGPAYAKELEKLIAGPS